MRKISPEVQVFRSQSTSGFPFKFKILFSILVFLILALAAFNFSLDRYGKFWEKEFTALTPTPLSGATPTPRASLKLSCPIPSQFCEQGRVLDAGGESFYGLGFDLPLGASLFAVFAGKVEDEPKIPNRLPSQPYLYLRDSQGREAIYNFFGTVSVPLGTEVFPGMEIGKIGPGSFPAVVPFVGLNSAFSLKTGGKYVRITSQDFIQ